MPIVTISPGGASDIQFDPTNPAGTWQVKVTAASQASTGEDRQLKGQATEGLVVFEPDHTLLSLAPSPEAGTWQADSSNSISFGFTEVSKYQADGTFTGFALVTQQGNLSEDGTTFGSSGQAIIYDAVGTYITTIPTTTQATRVS